ncbi:MAG: replication initiator protein A [Albidovulum sp.]|nr:replication initiator protein A [Albidovulum sp.]
MPPSGEPGPRLPAKKKRKRRYTQPNFWTIEMSSVSIKDSQEQLQYPLFVLDKHARGAEVHRYEDGAGNWLEVKSNADGMPTIFDKDILIYGISLLVQDLDDNREISRPTIRFHIANILEFLQKKKGGPNYQRIDKALRRLAGTTLETNIRTDGIETTEIFHIVDRATIKRKYDAADGRLQYCEFTLSEWLWRAVKARNVLTLHPDYFLLPSALARRIYEIARKFCGYKSHWKIGLALLREKAGAKSELSSFRQQMHRLARTADLLDYDIEFGRSRATGEEQVIFLRREGGEVEGASLRDVEISGSTIAAAQDIIGNRGTARQALADYRAWMRQQNIAATNPAAHYLAFVRTWAGRREAKQLDNNKKLPLREQLSRVWWSEDLTNEQRGTWRERIGRRFELPNGEGWMRGEESFAFEAFGREYPESRNATSAEIAVYRLPRPLVDRVARKIGGLPPIDLAIAAWRLEAAAETDHAIRGSDLLVRFGIFAYNLQRGHPSAIKWVDKVQSRGQEVLSATEAIPPEIIWWRGIPEERRRSIAKRFTDMGLADAGNEFARLAYQLHREFQG